MTETPLPEIYAKLRKNAAKGGPSFVRVVDAVEGSTGAKGPDIENGLWHVAYAAKKLASLLGNPDLREVRLSDTTLQSVIPPKKALEEGSVVWPLLPDHPAVEAQVSDIAKIAGVVDPLPPYKEQPDGEFTTGTNLGDNIVYIERRTAQPPMVTIFAARLSKESLSNQT